MSSRIAICLYEDSIDSLTAPYLLAGKDLQKVRVLMNYDDQVLLYQRRSESASPEWVEIVKGFGDLKDVDLSTASSGAILLIKIGKRIMGCCFGSSVSNINRSNIVNDFGLGVAFHRIVPKDTKSIESFTLSHNPITNNRNAAITTTKNNFNVDAALENITELSGFFKTLTGNILIKGKEFFSTPSPLNLDGIIDLCKKLLDDYIYIAEDDNYKRLTATKKVKDRSVIDVLNEDLCKKIDRKSKDIFLIDYELMPDIDNYKFTLKGKSFLTLETKDFYEIIPTGHKVSIPYLRYKEIIPFNAGNAELAHWALFRCLFCSITLTPNTYILFKGSWYEVEKEYLDGLKEFIRSHEVDNLEDVFDTSWNGKDVEGAFNIEMAKQSGGQCWDKILYRHPDYSYGIEFCDVLHKDFIVHVKKSESSSLNSHLLLQTAVSAQLLRYDPLIRDWIKDISKNKFKKNQMLNPKKEFRNPNIGYLIVLMSQDPRSLADSLPFFSLISFNLVIKKIQQLGFEVKVGRL